MRVHGIPDNTTPRSSPSAHTFDVKAGIIENENTVGPIVDSVDDNLYCKEVSKLPSDPQKYSRKKI